MVLIGARLTSALAIDVTVTVAAGEKYCFSNDFISPDRWSLGNDNEWLIVGKIDYFISSVLPQQH